MAKVTYKMFWMGSILNQCCNEELLTLLDKRPTADVRQVYAFHEMTEEAVRKSTIAIMNHSFLHKVWYGILQFNVPLDTV